MANSDEIEDRDEIKRTWNKLENNFKNIGLKDGITTGKESSYQDTFDKGFIEGFRNGYVIGQYKAIAFLEEDKSQSMPAAAELLNKPKAGWCQICENEELLNSSLSEIIVHQTSCCDQNLTKLHSLYASQYSSFVKIPSKLNRD